MTGKKLTILSSDLSVVGFPRSGNTFLHYCNYLSYKLKEPQKHKLSGKALNECEYIITPLRDPLECISSRIETPIDPSVVDPFIKFYIRFMETAKANKDKILFLDFEKFKDDVNYVHQAIFEKFGITPLAYPAVDKIKEEMLKRDLTNNLPGDFEFNNREEARNYIRNHQDYQYCLDLYSELLPK